MPIYDPKSKIVPCPYCDKDRDCDYCDGTGLIYEGEIQYYEYYTKNKRYSDEDETY